ncbi:MAG TPA: DUF1287 domain-containing protein [Terriglobia bacterium]|nr:DUF1287 domain-containing protein [Terriglobia bacterium]
MLAPVFSLGQSSPGQTGARHEFLKKLVDAAVEQTRHVVRYDSEYVRIPYPGGDVPADTGVCADVVIRAYRAAGVDLQKEVHEDMKRHFSQYPAEEEWGQRHPDASIDHRRVPNLMAFFSRHGEVLSISNQAGDYAPGDLVTWDIAANLPHIGIVVDQKSASGRYLIVHNIGQGPQKEDVLFGWKITGHYRYFGPEQKQDQVQ